MTWDNAMAFKILLYYDINKFKRYANTEIVGAAQIQELPA